MFQSAVEVKTHRQDPLRRLCKFQCTKRVSLVLPIVIENGPPRANPPRRHLISNWTAWGLHFPFGAEWQSILNCKISRCGNNAISRIHVFCMILWLCGAPPGKKNILHFWGALAWVVPGPETTPNKQRSPWTAWQSRVPSAWRMMDPSGTKWNQARNQATVL